MSTQIADLPLLSVRGGARVGSITAPIINPHNLHIDGFWCRSSHSTEDLILLDIDVRELSTHGIVIDDHLKLSEPSELVRLQPILDLNFQAIGKAVFSGKKRLGKLAEYAFDDKSLFMQKLYVQPLAWHALGQSRLIFDRKSVTDVSRDRIVVSGPEEKSAQPARSSQPIKPVPGYSPPASASRISK